MSGPAGGAKQAENSFLNFKELKVFLDTKEFSNNENKDRKQRHADMYGSISFQGHMAGSSQ